jgi:hypothetical protein
LFRISLWKKYEIFITSPVSFILQSVTFRKDFVRRNKFVTKYEPFRTRNEWILSQNAKCSRYETEEVVAKCEMFKI